MSELIQLEMTLDEARETDRLIKRHINTTRYLLLDMRDRKGWKALGYESFGDYGKKSLGYEKPYLTQLADAGEISLQLGYDSEFAIANSIPKESQLRPLKAVPEEDRKAIWEEATRKAEEEHAKLTAKRVEEAVAEWKTRHQESQTESNERRIKIRELESQVDFLQSQPPPAPEVVEKIPDDYEAIKRQAAEAAQQLDALKKQQDKIVNDQVKAKLQGYQSELNKLESDKKAIEDIVARKKAYLDSLSGEVKRIETHQAVISGARLELINLAAFLNDMDPMSDPDTVRKWLALADMHREAEQAIRSVFQDSTIRRVA
jgi:hypothetical protein